MQGVKAEGAGSTSCGEGSDGRGFALELEPETWPGMRLRALEAEWLLLPVVVEAELE